MFLITHVPKPFTMIKGLLFILLSTCFFVSYSQKLKVDIGVGGNYGSGNRGLLNSSSLEVFGQTRVRIFPKTILGYRAGLGFKFNGKSVIETTPPHTLGTNVLWNHTLKVDQEITNGNLPVYLGLGYLLQTQRPYRSDFILEEIDGVFRPTVISTREAEASYGLGLYIGIRKAVTAELGFQRLFNSQFEDYLSFRVAYTLFSK